MQSKDLRVRRTHKLLQSSLIELVKEKPFDKITVTDICERAMVHRATFYTHFEDKYQLLDDCIGGFFSAFDEVAVTEHSVDGYKEYFTNVARKILADIEKNKAVYKAFMRQNDATFEHTLTQNVYEKLCVKYDNCVAHGVIPSAPKEIFASFYAGACSSLVMWWIKSDMPVSSDVLVGYMGKFIAQIE